ncbi:hypothetical protein [Kineosporia succinea]
MALVWLSTLEPSLTTDQVPPDFDQALVLPDSKSAVNVLVCAAWAPTTVTPAPIRVTRPAAPAICRRRARRSFVIRFPRWW